MDSVIVIGGGIAGLAVARAISAARPRWRLTLLEASDRVGGKMLTTRTSGYTFEHAATGLLANRPETAAFIAGLGLSDRLEPATEAARRQFLRVRGGLHPVPRTLGGALRSRILSPRGKLRVLAEPLVRRRPPDEDESVYAFAARRFGHEFARVVAQTAVLGVGAGDAEETSVRAVFPWLHGLERAAGRTGLLGLAARGALGGPDGPGGGVRAGPSALSTFRDGGLNTLPDALATVLGDRIRRGAWAHEIHPGEHRRYSVVLDTGAALEADTVIVAVPAYEAAPLLRGLAPGAATRLSELSCTGLRVLGLGYRAEDLPRPFDGFGFLVSPGEDLRVLAVVVSSNLFPGQAPRGRVLLRVFLGGRSEPELAYRPRAEAVEIARSALGRTLGITAPPELVLDAPWPRGAPQYRPGHLAWLREVTDGLADLPGIHLTGSSYRGLGLDDTIREATDLAVRVIAGNSAWQEANAS